MSEQRKAWISWEEPILIHNQPFFEDAGRDARDIRPGKFGSQYGRMAKLSNGDWLIVYTIYANKGYGKDPEGGNTLEFAVSSDGTRTWTVIGSLSDPGRDLDNGQMIQLEDGSLLLGLRSVIWQQSYRVEAYRSTDLGRTWTYLSLIDSNEGEPGELGNPDRGVYETHFCQLDNGDLGVMYASEKYALASPAYSQVLSQKISKDGGRTWGDEIWVSWDEKREQSRPGMPVWTRMANGKYIVVLEVCGTEKCDVYFKTSDDGVIWGEGIGTPIPHQKGGPYVESLADGTVVVTSNSHELSYSGDFGATWHTNETAPFGSWTTYENVWPSIYQTGQDELAVVTSVARARPGEESEGHQIQIRFGRITQVR
ncbi:sialidase family protein [Cohnella fermenti]|uniref:Exo-alpha-sialidase n=1 Tax=Cohnella fermenti TaxID=2565925 RepID=A0A4S4BYM9_9BACL|nr:sialidase family protein [Cohnella fermenti]THF80376.1 exo-alpha-sialidase [Cohnella fermenti]